MSKRHPNPRLAKIHRNYTVEEVAGVFGVHRNTVREWVKRGLPTSDERRPMLILGADLVAFLRARRVKNKRTCQPGEMYCVRCRAPRAPAGDMADYLPVTAALGNLIGMCPACEVMMYRRVSLARIEQVRGKLDITLPQALPHKYRLAVAMYWQYEGRSLGWMAAKLGRIDFRTVETRLKEGHRLHVEQLRIRTQRLTSQACG